MKEELKRRESVSAGKDKGCREKQQGCVCV